MILKNLRKIAKQNFYSSLAGRKINDKEYEHALNVWNKFEMKTNDTSTNNKMSHFKYKSFITICI